jgi:hypothetical protein
MCVLIVGLAGFIQAVHVHDSNSKLSHHDRTICSVAHSGVIYQAVVSPVPVLHSTIVAPLVAAVVTQSSGFVSSSRIRPPPAV